MFELSVSKDVGFKKKGYNKGVGNREGSCRFMSSTNCLRIEN
jgi:hypothetical protein